jgi:hypothetical protein
LILLAGLLFFFARGWGAGGSRLFSPTQIFNHYKMCSMKKVCRSLFIFCLFVFVLGGCHKDNLFLPDEGLGAGIVTPMARPIFPFPPNPWWSKIPLFPLEASQCISSYDELVQVIGSDRLAAKAVILENDVRIDLGPELASMIYTAVPNASDHTSLFRSQFMIEWRRPGDLWQGDFTEVWSLGCVYTQNGVPPFTNLLKGGQVILINTCFIWSIDSPYRGLRVKYVVVD